MLYLLASISFSIDSICDAKCSININISKFFGSCSAFFNRSAWNKVSAVSSEDIRPVKFAYPNTAPDTTKIIPTVANPDNLEEGILSQENASAEGTCHLCSKVFSHFKTNKYPLGFMIANARRIGRLLSK